MLSILRTSTDCLEPDLRAHALRLIADIEESVDRCDASSRVSSYDLASVRSVLEDDVDLFRSFLDASFRLERRSVMQRINQLDEVKRDAVSHLLDEGVVSLPGFFTGENVAELSDFVTSVESLFDDNIKRGGYVNVCPPIGRTPPRLTSWLQPVVHDGQLRLQSKSHSFAFPGVDVVLQNDVLLQMASAVYDNDVASFYRSTIEWIHPAPFNHNGWHFDVVRPQYKVVLLLDDVDVGSAAMSYAVTSHRSLGDNELALKHDVFKHGAANCAAYFFDDRVDNRGVSFSECVAFGTSNFDVRLCTGAKGDVIVFDSAGLHSGNRSLIRRRSTMTSTFPIELSFLGELFDVMGQRGA